VTKRQRSKERPPVAPVKKVKKVKAMEGMVLGYQRKLQEEVKLNYEKV